MKYKTLFTISLLLFFSTPLSADDFRKADSFFEKNDSKGVADGDFYGTKRSNSYDAGAQFQDKQSGKIVQEDTKKQVKPNFFEQSDNKNEPSIPSNTRSNSNGTKVLSLGVVVNSLDENHLERHLNTLIQTSTKLDLDINEVDFIGTDNDVTKKFGLAIVSRFGQGNFMSAPPSEYNITASPTWILQTEKGQILLEGIDNPESYMTSNAEFIDGGGAPYQNSNEGNNSNFFGEKHNGMGFF